MTKTALAAFTLTVTILSWSSSAKEVIRFSCASQPDSVTHEYIEHIYSEFFENLGYEFVLISSAADQVEKLILNESVDGDCGHVQSFEASNSARNYVRGQSPVGSITLEAWSNQPIPDNFEFSTKTMGHEKGLHIATELIQRYSPEKTVALGNTKAGLNAITRGDIDIWIDKARNMESRLYRERPSHGLPLNSYLVYPFLHKKHKALLTQLDEHTEKKIKILPYNNFLSSSSRMASSQRNDNVMHFGCSAKPNSPPFQASFNVYKTAFKALGYDFIMSYVPTARGASNLKSGYFDGSCARSSTFIQVQAENIIVIEVPIAFTQMKVWSLSDSSKITSLDDIDKTNASVAIITGLVNLEERLKKHPNININRVTYPEQGLKLLASGRVDLYIGVQELAVHTLKNTLIDRPLYDAGLLFEETMYPVLHKKHSAIADAFTQELYKQLEPGNDNIIH